MKFNDIADGQQFIYQGNCYTRSGPLMASDADGNRKMIPRSAEVTPMAGTSPATQPKLEKQVTIARVMQSFDLACDQMGGCLKKLSSTGFDLTELNQCMETVRQAFIQNLQE